MGVERSYAAISGASLVIAVVDGSAAFTEEDSAILRFAENAPKAIVAVSKQDLPGFSSASVKTSLPVVEISAETGEGIDALEVAIQKMFPLPSVPAGEILTNARQAEAVALALDYHSLHLIWVKHRILSLLKPKGQCRLSESSPAELYAKTLPSEFLPAFVLVNRQ